MNFVIGLLTGAGIVLVYHGQSLAYRLIGGILILMALVACFLWDKAQKEILEGKK